MTSDAASPSQSFQSLVTGRQQRFRRELRGAERRAQSLELSSQKTACSQETERPTHPSVARVVCLVQMYSHG